MKFQQEVHVTGRSRWWPTIVGVALVVSVGLYIPTPSRASGLVETISVDQTQDVAEYSDRYRVSIDEAARRLKVMDDVGQVVLPFERLDGFAGAWIEHDPEFKVVVAFTDLAALDLDTGLLDGSIEYVTRPRRAVELRSAYESVAELLSSHSSEVTPQFTVALSLRRQTIEIATEDPNWVNTIVGKAVTAIDLSLLTIVPSAEMPTPVANLYGGLYLTVNGCTSGFAVKQGSVSGVTTAGHCGNIASYSGVNLPFKGGQYSGNVDLQWHSRNTHTVKPWVQDGQWDTSTPYYRVINSMLASGNMTEGQWVCKYGRVTKYGCGEIIDDSYQPGSTCIPNPGTTFRRVRDPYGADLAEGGDSGGPVFRTNAAAGSIACQNGKDLIFMPIYNGLNALNITLVFP